ncbi:MAG: carbohydrate-binding domain-containing protein [Eubacteriales bacterium]
MIRLIQASTTLLTLLLVGCESGNPPEDVVIPTITPEIEVQIPENLNISTQRISPEEFFSDRDYRTELDSDSPVTLTFSGNSITSDGDGVSISGSTVTITQEGTYILTGSLSDGQVLVEMEDDTAKAQLVLDGVSLSCSSAAPIHVANADKVFITMMEGSKNFISAKISEDAEADGGIFSRSDLTLNGEGTLTIDVENGAGIVAKDELTITSGTYHITADDHGMDANDGIAIADGVFDITAQKDGLHCEHSTNLEKGNIYILNGTFTLKVEQDGLDAGGFLEILDGIFDITTCGGSDAAPIKVAASNTNFGMQGGRPGMSTTNQTFVVEGEEEDLPSTKGLKSVGEMRLFGGTFILDCYDDSMHSDSILAIFDGDYTLSTGDDAIHANWDTVISGGNIDILTCFEGIEGQRVYILGGIIDMYAGDDGINAASTSLDPNDSSISMNISGGQITIDSNAEGDGLDSNGNILITGGAILISSTTDQRDTALDSNGTSLITGGTFFATGSNSATLQNFDSGSTQGSILVQLSAMQEGQITLTDSQGTVIADFMPVKAYQAVTLSSPDLVVGETYTLTMGSQTQTIVLDTLLYGGGQSNMGGIGGNQGDITAGMTPGMTPEMGGGRR